jgi:general secretion pathway protein D
MAAFVVGGVASITLEAPRAFAQEAQVLNVQNADIRAFIQDVARMTGRTFVVDSRVTGNVTVTSTKPLSRIEVFEVFLSTLRANGLVAVPAGNGAYRIVPEENAAKQPAAVGSGSFSTRVFRLNNVDAASVVDTLKPLIGTQGQVIANKRSNTVVVSDYADNVARVAKLVSEIDSDAMRIETITLRHSSAPEIAAVIRDLADGPGSERNSSTVTVIPVESSNSIVLRGPRSMIDRLMPVIADLDGRAGNPDDVGVVFLKHANAEKLLPVLEQLLGQKGDSIFTRQNTSPSQNSPRPVSRIGNDKKDPSSPAEAPDFSDRSNASSGISTPKGSVAVYAGANALIINADPETQRRITEVIRKLDVRRQQVLVEAIVVEISDDAVREIGSQFIMAGESGFASNSSPNAKPNIYGLTGAAVSGSQFPAGSTGRQQAGEAIFRNLSTARGLVLGGVGQSGDQLFSIIINAVKLDTKSNLLSTPSVMTLDNEKASLLVGQDVPITTGEVLGNNNDNPFRTVERTNVGVQLDVRPQINEDGVITLFLRQEVSGINENVSVSSGDLILNKREIETTVLVDDGAIVVLGGLMDEKESLTTQKIPGLGDIPGVGRLFTNKSRTKVKTNLMVFIRPTIVRSSLEAEALTKPRYNQIRRAQNQSAEPDSTTLDELITEYMGGVAPAPDVK